MQAASFKKRLFLYLVPDFRLFFFFWAHAAEGGTGSAPGFRFRGSVKAATHWHFPRTRYCSRNISGKPAKAPELPAAPSAPLAHLPGGSAVKAFFIYLLYSVCVTRSNYIMIKGVTTVCYHR